MAKKPRQPAVTEADQKPKHEEPMAVAETPAASTTEPKATPVPSPTQDELDAMRNPQKKRDVVADEKNPGYLTR